MNEAVLLPAVPIGTTLLTPAGSAGTDAGSTALVLDRNGREIDRARARAAQASGPATLTRPAMASPPAAAQPRAHARLHTQPIGLDLAARALPPRPASRGAHRH